MSMGEPVLQRLYRFDPELEKFVDQLYVVARSIPASHVSAACRRDSYEISLSTTPGQPVRVTETPGSTIMEFPEAGKPGLYRDLTKYQGKRLEEALGVARGELQNADNPQEWKRASRILRDLYHELAHKVTHYTGLDVNGGIGNDLEGRILFMERFWFSYADTGNEYTALEGARRLLMDDLHDLMVMPVRSVEDAEYSKSKLNDLNDAVGTYWRVARGATPEDVLF
jgi:hypothetical protein